MSAKRSTITSRRLQKTRRPSWHSRSNQSAGYYTSITAIVDLIREKISRAWSWRGEILDAGCGIAKYARGTVCSSTSGARDHMASVHSVTFTDETLAGVKEAKYHDVCQLLSQHLNRFLG